VAMNDVNRKKEPARDKKPSEPPSGLAVDE